MNRMIIAIAISLLLTSCGLKTTVVLVPDDDGQLGRVDVKTPTAGLTLDGARNYTVASKTLTPLKEMDEQDIRKDFSAALAAAPERPESYLLFFLPDSIELKPSSRQEIANIAAAIKTKKRPVLTIIGHTDTTGSDELNIRLSLNRAEAVAALLQKEGLPRETMHLQYFGKADLLVPTPDGVPEPRNRRVEIFIH